MHSNPDGLCAARAVQAQRAFLSLIPDMQEVVLSQVAACVNTAVFHKAAVPEVGAAQPLVAACLLQFLRAPCCKGCAHEKESGLRQPQLGCRRRPAHSRTAGW